MEDFDFTAKDDTLEAVLWGSDIFQIPRYQRSYSWDVSKIEDLWQDIFINEDTLFLGSFIFNKESGNQRVEVIDGQQRIVTITILTSVLRDIAKENELEIATSIQDNYIRGNFLRDEFRLICGDSLNKFFLEYIQEFPKKNFPPERELTKETRLITKNYKYLKDVVNEYISSKEDNTVEESIKELLKKLAEIKVIRIEIKREDFAYDIFETVNARGQELAVSDLLKNLIFKNVREDDGGKDKAKEIWKDIEANVEDDMKQFVRYYWLSRYESVTSKALYKKIKSRIRDYSEFLDTLHRFSDYYRMLKSGEKSDWINDKYDDGKKIFHCLQGIRAMGVTQCYVLFMSLMEHKGILSIKLYKWFELIENFSFNYFAIGKMPANKVEKLFSKIAVDIWKVSEERNPKKQQKEVNRIYSNLKRKLEEFSIAEEQFHKNFLEVSYKNSEQSRIFIKYILSKLEKSKGSRELSLDFDEISIEHILPQTPSEEWNLQREDIAEYVNLVGNLTIITQELNGRLGNKPIKDKVELLNERSTLALNKELCEMIKENNFIWGEKEIQKRSEELAKDSFKVWEIR